MTSRAIIYAATACASALVWASQAQAQTAPTPPAAPAADTTPQSGEILVTARKRTESILKVPVIETAVPRARLEALHVTDLRDVTQLAPGLGIGRSVGTIGSQISIRGVGTITLDAGVDQSVALNIDGMPIGNGLALQSGLFDVGQVQVLKGPQSLFYGKSSTGGVLAITSADPTNKTEVIATQEYEVESVDPRESLILSGPVTDTLKMRLAAQYTDAKGYFNIVSNPEPGTGGLKYTGHGPGNKGYTVRGTVLWDPTPQFEAKLKINSVESHTTNQDEVQFQGCPGGTNVVSPSFGVQFIANQPCKLTRTVHTVAYDPAVWGGNLVAPRGGIPFLDTYQKYGTLDLTYHIRPDVTLTSTTGYYNIKAEDFDSGVEATFAAQPFRAINHYQRYNWTEEARVNTDFSGPLNFTGGVFFESGRFNYIIDFFLNPAELGTPAPIEAIHVDDILTNQTYSTFGQLRWKIVPDLELDAGARFSDETRTESAFNFLSGIPEIIATPRVHASNVTPDVTLTYTPTSDLTLYAAFREAFKSGGFATSTQPDGNVLSNAFGEEKVIGGEAGVKSRWLDRRLTLDAAFFYYDYSGLQVGAVTPPKPGGIAQTTTQNAGGANSYGIDFDATWTPESIEGLSFNVAGEWDIARFTNLTTLPCWGGQTIAEGCDLTSANGKAGGPPFLTQNLNGSPLDRAPDWQINGGVTYQKRLANGVKLTFTNNESYSSKYVAAPAANYPGQANYQQAFVKVDLGLMLDTPDNKWEFAIVGKNIFDKITAGTCTNDNAENGGGIFGTGEITGATGHGPILGDDMICFSDPGREIWLRVTWRPFG